MRAFGSWGSGFRPVLGFAACVCGRLGVACDLGFSGFGVSAGVSVLTAGFGSMAVCFCPALVAGFLSP